MAESARIRTPRAQRLEELRGTPLTVAVWLTAVVLVVFMLAERGTHVRYAGIARPAYHEVSTTSGGRLDSVVVGLFERVAPDDILAVLDPAPVRARLATAEAELDRLDAELAAAVTLSSTDALDWEADLRRFTQESANRLLDELRLNVTIESDEVAAQLMALRLQRVSALHAEGVVSDEELDEIRLRYEALRRRIDENKVLAAGMRDQYLHALERERDFRERSPAESMLAGPAGPLRAALEVQRRRIDEMRLEREALVLRAPVAGQVSAVLASAGQAVLAGEPIVTVARSVVTEVVAYAAGADPNPVVPGQRVLLARAVEPSNVAESVVLRVSPTIDLLPQRLWVAPDAPEYGRAFVVTAAALELVPDEVVRVRVIDS